MWCVCSFGRKLALMGLVAMQAASSIAVAWAPTFVVYVILRFITGFSISGLFLVIFVLGENVALHRLSKHTLR